MIKTDVEGYYPYEPAELLKLHKTLRPIFHKRLPRKDFDFYCATLTNKGNFEGQKLRGLEPVAKINMNIPCGYSYLFRPTADDVVKRIPLPLLKEGVCLYSIKQAYRVSFDCENPAVVTLYRMKDGKKPFDENEDIIYTGKEI